MSEPVPPLPPDLRSLLDVDRQDVPEPPGVKSRVLRRLEAKLLLDTTARPEVVATRTIPGRSRTVRWLTRIGVGGATGIARLAVAFASGGVVALGVNGAVEHRREVRLAHERVQAQRHAPAPAGAQPAPEPEIGIETPPAPSPTTPLPEPQPVGSVVPTIPGHRRPAPGKPVSARPASGVPGGIAAEERVLLEDARASLQRGDSTTALELLTAHEQRFPTSPLSEERDALLIREAVQAGSNDEARAWLKAFREHYPESPLLPILESTLKDVHDQP